MLQHTKQLVINLIIAASIQLVYFLFSGQKPLDQEWETDFFRGGLLLFILLIGMIGATGEIKEIRKYGFGGTVWFFLSFFATVGHIMLLFLGMKYLGLNSFLEGEENADPIAIIGILIIVFFFLFEVIASFLDEEKTTEPYTRVIAWSDVLLIIYAAFGSAYIWDISMTHMEYKFINWPYFLFAELLPSVLLFVIIVLPFKRYFIIERKLLVKDKKQEILFYLSYLLVIISGILPMLKKVF